MYECDLFESKWIGSRGVDQLTDDKFGLGFLPQSHYDRLYANGCFEITEDTDPLDLEGKFTHQAHLKMGDEADDRFFEIYINLESNVLPPMMSERARLVAENVVAMDAAARSIPDDFDDSERLAYIHIRRADVKFRYWANTVNTEWDVVFNVDQSGHWQCLGIPKWQDSP